MSFRISFAVKGKDEAKAELSERCGIGFVPKPVEAAISALIDDLPDSGIDHIQTINVASYGHFRRDGNDPCASSVTIQVQQVAN